MVAEPGPERAAGLRPVLLAVLLAGLVAALLAGCTADRDGAAAPAATEAVAAGATSSTSPSQATTPAPDRMSAPAKRSGPLSGRDMPRPASLGPGWRFRVDDGSQEDGYVGNGTPTVQREPGEVAGLAVPLGCVDRGRLPRPRWALETDYAHASTDTIGLVVRLRFATVSDATGFLRGRDAALAACAAQTSGDGPNSTGLVQQLRIEPGLTVSTRTEAGDLHDGSAWTEVAQLATPPTDVILVALNVPQSARVTLRVLADLRSTG